MRPIPFEHRELRRMKRGALATAIDTGKVEDAPLAGSEQLFAGKLGRGVQIKLFGAAVGPHHGGGNRMKMRLVAGRELQRTAFDFGEVMLREPSADCRPDPIARQKNGPAIDMDFGAP